MTSPISWVGKLPGQDLWKVSARAALQWISYCHRLGTVPGTVPDMVEVRNAVASGSGLVIGLCGCGGGRRRGCRRSGRRAGHSPRPLPWSQRLLWVLARLGAWALVRAALKVAAGITRVAAPSQVSGESTGASELDLPPMACRAVVVGAHRWLSSCPRLPRRTRGAVAACVSL